MINRNTKIAGAGIAIFVGMMFLIIAIWNIPNAINYVSGAEMKIKNELDVAQLVVSITGFAGASVAFGFAIMQYRRSEKWKRIEFIANEVKEFESDLVVQNALLMVDWGDRLINLFLVSEPEKSDFYRIDRDAQWKALLPHTLKHKHQEYQSDEKFERSAVAVQIKEPNAIKESSPTNKKNDRPTLKKFKFTVEEAKIRDTYDVFLTRLDRFATFIDAKLIDAEDLKPFINYWIEALTKNENPTDDAAWRCTLLTYINYYGYSGVQKLFKTYGKDISPDEVIYQEVKKSVADKMLAERLYEKAKNRDKH